MHARARHLPVPRPKGLAPYAPQPRRVPGNHRLRRRDPAVPQLDQPAIPRIQTGPEGLWLTTARPPSLKRDKGQPEPPRTIHHSALNAISQCFRHRIPCSLAGSLARLSSPSPSSASPSRAARRPTVRIVAANRRRTNTAARASVSTGPPPARKAPWLSRCTLHHCTSRSAAVADQTARRITAGRCGRTAPSCCVSVPDRCRETAPTVGSPSVPAMSTGPSLSTISRRLRD